MKKISIDGNVFNLLIDKEISGKCFLQKFHDNNFAPYLSRKVFSELVRAFKNNDQIAKRIFLLLIEIKPFLILKGVDLYCMEAEALINKRAVVESFIDTENNFL